MAVAFPSHATPGEQMQLAINLRSQLVQSTFVAPAPCLKQLGDLVSESVVHPKSLGRRSGQLPSTLPHYPAVSAQISRPRNLPRAYRFAPQFSLYEVKANSRCGENDNRAQDQRRRK